MKSGYLFGKALNLFGNLLGKSGKDSTVKMRKTLQGISEVAILTMTVIEFFQLMVEMKSYYVQQRTERRLKQLETCQKESAPTKEVNAL